MTSTRSQSVAELDRKIDENHGAVNARMAQLQATIEELKTLMIAQARRSSEASNESGPVTPPINPRVETPRAHTDPPPLSRNYATRISKVDFARFDGKKVKDWLYKCDQFFLLDETPPESRVRLASIHLEGLALQWHLNYMRGRFDEYPTWSQYAADVKRKFGDLYEDPLSELIQVKHTSSVQSYIDDFELALTQINILPEFALSIFLSGLDHNTQTHVRMINPTTIPHAANLVKLHEAAKPHTQKQPFKPPFQKLNTTQNTTPILDNPPNQKNAPTKPFRSFSKAQLEERSAKGLCWYCDEPLTPGHHLKHRGRQTLMMMEVDEGDADVTDEAKDEIDADISVAEAETPQISLHALIGSSHYQTMRVKGLYCKRLLQILLDSGSTHNFLDLHLARKLGCLLTEVKAMSIIGGGGHKLDALFICKGFKWVMHGQEFVADMIVLPLASCDMILGVQWLKSLGPILWDFEKLQMEFTWQERRMVLRGSKASGVKLITNKSLNVAVEQGAELCFLQVNHTDNQIVIPTCEVSQSGNTECPVPTKINELIDEFYEIYLVGFK